ncbi:hypothetical protein EV278_1147 [Caulobacter sp. BK020]|nr:hypothetical protein EV278_1147 [Caulobacter sp. BK020]
MEEGRVVPLLLDLDFSDISGPLSQFQAKKVEKQGIKDIVFAINRIWSNPIPDDRQSQLFEALWGQMEQAIGEIQSVSIPIKPHRPQADILEELVSSVRNLDLRYREDMQEGRGARRSKSFHHKMMVMDDFFHRVADRGDYPGAIMLGASVFREDYPWVYEAANRVYNDVVTGKADAVRRSQKQFFEAAEALRRGPFLDEMQDRAMGFLMHVVDRAVELGISDRTVKREVRPRPTIPRPSITKEAG